MSGAISSRMSMFVLCPPLRETEEPVKEAEVDLFLDVYQANEG